MIQWHISNKRQPQGSKRIHQVCVQSKTATDWEKGKCRKCEAGTYSHLLVRVQNQKDTHRSSVVVTQAGTWGVSPCQPEDSSIHYEPRSRWGCLGRGVSWPAYVLKNYSISISGMECSGTREYIGRSAKISVIQGKDNRGSLCVYVFWVCVFAFFLFFGFFNKLTIRLACHYPTFVLIKLWP